ncbi:hypothetical protein ACQUW5_13920 [Legionella sp. CNM-1927-20]|uniref:hypothetical protein n=1 Tax=Legionella sp. CNM-1927-20 TaxID=3422221 RepID=UPI00403A99FF
MRTLKFLILDRNGILLATGGKELEKQLQTPFLAPSDSKPNNDYFHAYGAFEAEYDSEKNVQFILIQPVRGKDSPHGAIPDWLKMKSLVNYLEQQGIKIVSNNMLYAGDCKSSLLVNQVIQTVNKPLEGVFFNTKSTMAQIYKPIAQLSTTCGSSTKIEELIKKYDAVQQPPSPRIPTNIPKKLFLLDAKWDNGVKLDSPSRRRKMEQQSMQVSPFFSRKERRDKDESDEKSPDIFIKNI